MKTKEKVFVEHIENHLKEMKMDGKVCCKLCNKNIDEIYANEQEKSNMKKYLKFKKREDALEWMVLNKKNQFLGDIAWQKSWKKFAFYPDTSIYERDIYLCSMCLREIVEQLDKLNKQEKI